MKDATGELSMTAIVVVAIAAISVVFTTLIYPRVKDNILRSSYCSNAYNCVTNSAGDKMASCTYCEDAECKTEKQVSCPVQEGID